ncbi:GTP-binding conserved hypothetical domain-containing protein, putative [Eimeria brunetti]|uniref:GTP-binding conserved hypothetical domain-containing protein, putative n=1 Tax=Eimeria brunetti TaxID=51314 RepID=U6LEG2_9EIME|nr:GTP-binding conserved hypothetical domain-containing protein, putative [Eimeria brunetti]
MAGGPTSLSCCFCFAPARPAGGPLLPRPLRVGPAPASLRLPPSLFDPVAGHNRIISPFFAFHLHGPLRSPPRHGQGFLARLPTPFSQKDLGSSNWVRPGFNQPGSLPHSVSPGPSLPLGALGIASERGAPPQQIPLRLRLRAIKRLDPKLQHQVLRDGLGRPRCQRAQRLLKRGDPQSVSARCPFFLQQLKPRLRLWKKALTAEELPPPLYPEVAFAGRSNAGKSTLLNELCGRSGTAAVSRRPGSTQELFFFKAGSPCCLCLVDLPGYGYAEADAAKRLQWTEMSLYYLKARPNLKRVFLLVDARWGLKASDVCLLSFFERHRVPFQLVLTKADLPEQKSLIKILQIVRLLQHATLALSTAAQSPSPCHYAALYFTGAAAAASSVVAAKQLYLPSCGLQFPGKG